jgi:hypothetical protein
MPALLSDILAPLDRASVERERDKLREELEDYEALLRLIDRHGAGTDMPTAPGPAPARDADPPVDAPLAANRNGNGHTPLSEKRNIVLAIMRERPGRWSTVDLRKALTERGIDPQAGTPVKNILWQLAKAGTVSAAGSGVYEFPALTESPDDPRVQEAMGL